MDQHRQLRGDSRRIQPGDATGVLAGGDGRLLQRALATVWQAEETGLAPARTAGRDFPRSVRAWYAESHPGARRAWTDQRTEVPGRRAGDTLDRTVSGQRGRYQSRLACSTAMAATLLAPPDST